MPPKATATSGKGHNGTGLDDNQEKVFIREFSALKAAESSMAGTKGEMNGSYKRLEQAGFTKDHIKWAQTLEKSNVSEIIRDLRMKIAIAKLMGHAAGRQLDLIDDRTPLEDQAYLEGLAAGKLGRDATNPYGMETVAGQAWQRGMNEGNVLRNAALNEALNGGQESPEIIRGPGETGDGGDDDASSEDETSEGDGEVAVRPGADDVSENHSGNSEPGEGSGEAATPIEGEIIPPQMTSDDDWDAAAPAPAKPSRKKK